MAKITVTVHEDVAEYLNNNKRRFITELETKNNVTIRVAGEKHVSPEHLVIECRDKEDRILATPK
ncbi:MAG: hypothetical protein H5U08_16880 [Thermogutta sp.]|nr:hypothetical protein [Thermogutta sp.]